LAYDGKRCENRLIRSDVFAEANECPDNEDAHAGFVVFCDNFTASEATVTLALKVANCDLKVLNSAVVN
jgi:hypothetical protein